MNTRQVQLVNDAIAMSGSLNSAITALQDEAGKQEDREGSFATEFPAALEQTRGALNGVRGAMEALYDAVERIQRFEGEEVPEEVYDGAERATDDLRRYYRAYEGRRGDAVRLYARWAIRNGAMNANPFSDFEEARRNHAFHENEFMDCVDSLLGIPID